MSRHPGAAPHRTSRIDPMHPHAVEELKTAEGNEMTVTQERHPAVEQFEREGFVVFRDVLDAELIREASDHVEWLMRRHPDERPERLGHDDEVPTGTIRRRNQPNGPSCEAPVASIT